MGSEKLGACDAHVLGRYGYHMKHDDCVNWCEQPQGEATPTAQLAQQFCSDMIDNLRHNVGEQKTEGGEKPLVTCKLNSNEHTLNTHGPRFPCVKPVPSEPSSPPAPPAGGARGLAEEIVWQRANQELSPEQEIIWLTGKLEAYAAQQMRQSEMLRIWKLKLCA